MKIRSKKETNSMLSDMIEEHQVETILGEITESFLLRLMFWVVVVPMMIPLALAVCITLTVEGILRGLVRIYVHNFRRGSSG